LSCDTKKLKLEREKHLWETISFLPPFLFFLPPPFYPHPFPHCRFVLFQTCEQYENLMLELEKQLGEIRKGLTTSKWAVAATVLGLIRYVIILC
jgi:hypothetical protein